MSVPAVLDSGDSSCERRASKKKKEREGKKMVVFSGAVFQGAAVRIFQGGLRWINSAWTFFRHWLVVCRSEKKAFWSVCCAGSRTTSVCFATLLVFHSLIVKLRRVTGQRSELLHIPADFIICKHRVHLCGCWSEWGKHFEPLRLCC